MTTTIACELGLHKRCPGEANTSASAAPAPGDLVPCECPCHDHGKAT
jgi:hypothetical protein